MIKQDEKKQNHALIISPKTFGQKSADAFKKRQDKAKAQEAEHARNIETAQGKINAIEGSYNKKGRDKAWMDQQKEYLRIANRDSVPDKGWHGLFADPDPEEKLDKDYRAYAQAKKRLERLKANGVGGARYTKEEMKERNDQALESVRLDAQGVAHSDAYNRSIGGRTYLERVKNHFGRNFGFGTLAAAGTMLAPVAAGASSLAGGIAGTTAAAGIGGTGVYGLTNYMIGDQNHKDAADLWAKDPEAFKAKYGDAANKFTDQKQKLNARTTRALINKNKKESMGLNTSKEDALLDRTGRRQGDLANESIEESLIPGSINRNADGSKGVKNRFKDMFGWIGANPIKSALGAYVLYSMFSGGRGYQMGPMGGYGQPQQQGNIITRNPLLSTAVLGTGGALATNSGLFGEDAQKWWQGLWNADPKNNSKKKKDVLEEGAAQGVEGTKDIEKTVAKATKKKKR